MSGRFTRRVALVGASMLCAGATLLSVLPSAHADTLLDRELHQRYGGQRRRLGLRWQRRLRAGLAPCGVPHRRVRHRTVADQGVRALEPGRLGSGALRLSPATNDDAASRCTTTRCPPPVVSTSPSTRRSTGAAAPTASASSSLTGRWTSPRPERPVAVSGTRPATPAAPPTPPASTVACSRSASTSGATSARPPRRAPAVQRAPASVRPALARRRTWSQSAGDGSGTTGYCWLGASADLGSTLSGADRASATVRVHIVIDPAGNGTRNVTVSLNGTQVLQVPAPAALLAATSFKFGFSGSTGSVTDIHEVWNLSINSVIPVPTTSSAPATTVAGTQPTVAPTPARRRRRPRLAPTHRHPPRPSTPTPRTPGERLTEPVRHRWVESGEAEDGRKIEVVVDDVVALDDRRIRVDGVVVDARVPHRQDAHRPSAHDVGAAQVAHVCGAAGLDAAQPLEGVLEDAAVGLVDPDLVARTTSGRSTRARPAGRGSDAAPSTASGRRRRRCRCAPRPTGARRGRPGRSG